eukprot:378715_1
MSQNNQSAIQCSKFIQQHYPQYHNMRQQKEREERMNKLNAFIDGFIRINHTISNMEISQQDFEQNVKVQENELIIQSCGTEPKFFVISKQFTSLSELISTMVEGDAEMKLVKLRLSVDALTPIVEYLEHHKGKQPNFDGWNIKWIASFNMKQTFQMLFAADYLDIKSLLDLCCDNIAKTVKQLDQKSINYIVATAAETKYIKNNSAPLSFKNTHSDIYNALQQRLNCDSIHYKLIKDIDHHQTSTKKK